MHVGSIIPTRSNPHNPHTMQNRTFIGCNELQDYTSPISIKSDKDHFNDILLNAVFSQRRVTAFNISKKTALIVIIADAVVSSRKRRPERVGKLAYRSTTFEILFHDLL